MQPAMLVEEVLRLCDRGPSPAGFPLEATPAALDSVASLKRKRSASGAYDSSEEAATCLAVAEGDGPAAAPCAFTPPAAATAVAAPPSPRSREALPGVPWAASFLLDYVHHCLANLASLHPTTAAIRTHTKAAEMACAIFRRAYLARELCAQLALVRERALAGSLLAAALWLAIKFEATRTTTPDANLMSRISGVPAGLLRHQERQILAELGWDLMGPAREVGAVAMPDPSDEVCRDQQRQLAALAASRFAAPASGAAPPMLPPPLVLAPAASAGAVARAVERAGRWHGGVAARPAAGQGVQQALLCNLLMAPAEDLEPEPAARQHACVATTGPGYEAQQLLQLLGGLPAAAAHRSLAW